MKKWLVIFVGSIYLFALMVTTEMNPIFWVITAVITFVSACFNIASAIRMQFSKTEMSMVPIMILKLCLLPVYAFCFMVFAVSVLMFFSIWLAVPALLTFPVVVAFSFFVLIVSSSLAISRIIVLRRQKVLSTTQCVVHSILQLIFVVDAVSCIIVCVKERKSRR